MLETENAFAATVLQSMRRRMRANKNYESKKINEYEIVNI